MPDRRKRRTVYVSRVMKCACETVVVLRNALIFFFRNKENDYA